MTHIHVFGCVCYAKVDTAHIKKLDDRSRALVHLGTEPGSKAYRLLDPTHRRTVVSRDISFDENKCWEWNVSGADMTTEQPGMFKVTFGDYGNNGIQGEADETEPEEEHSKEEETLVPTTTTLDQDVGTSNEVPRRSTRVTKRPSYLDQYI